MTRIKGLSLAVAATVALLAAGEGLLNVAYLVRNSAAREIPLPYMIGDEYGAVPPWVDGLRILERDATLIWRNRPGLRRRYVDVFSPAWTEEERIALVRRFLPTVPESLRQSPVWEISLNSSGFRDDEFPSSKRPSSFRIICLGDSWTFGANVGQQDAYPQKLRALLGREFPRGDFEVFNLGVLGYSSYQGLQLLKRTLVQRAPDLLVIAFAMNDAKVAGYRDKDMAEYREPVVPRLGRALEMLESYKLLRYVALRVKEKRRSVGDRVRATAAAGASEKVEYDRLEAWTRVGPGDYEENIRQMIGLARGRGAGVVLLANELWESPYRALLEKISRAEGVPLVDALTLIAAARHRMEEEIERRLDLRPALAGRRRGAGDIDVVFRVYAGDHPVPKAIYIAGSHPRLGDVVPNRVRMYDDGTHGDQRAGDSVWSYLAAFPRRTLLSYVYTNSGREGKWEGLDVPHVRRFRVEPPDGDAVYRPIESFGKVYMQADSWHTDAAGYELIAGAVLDAVKRNGQFQRYLARSATAEGGRSAAPSLAARR